MDELDQLLIDVRTFQIKSDPDFIAGIGFAARIAAKDGRLVASRVFVQSPKVRRADPSSAATAFDDGFKSIATELVTWTAGVL
jgi:ABC-type uncharacterized transport system auxiliary subunit